jgi:hypothetical protein
MKKIRFLSDGNEMIMISETKNKKNSDSTFKYEYVKSNTKKGMILEFTFSQLEYLIKTQIISIC